MTMNQSTVRRHIPEMIVHRDNRPVVRVSDNKIMDVPARVRVSVPLCEWDSSQQTIYGLGVRAFHCLGDHPYSWMRIWFDDAPVEVAVYFEAIAGPITEPLGFEQRWNVNRIRIVASGDALYEGMKVIRDNTCSYAVDFDIVMRALAKTIREGYSHEAACRNDIEGFLAYYDKQAV